MNKDDLKKYFAPFATLIVAAVLLLIYQYIFTPNVPLQDQWFMIKMFKNPTFANFWEQRGEHRILFPRLIYFFLARLSGWDFRLETGASVLFLSVLIFLIYHAFSRCVKDELALWIFAFCLLVQLSPIHHENILWGYQLQVTLCALMVFIALWLAPFAYERLGCLFIMLLSLVIASLSFFSGLFGWILAPFVLIKARKWKALNLSLFIGAAIAVFVLYFVGFKISPYTHPERVSFAGLLWQEPLFFFIFMGANFVPTWKVGVFLTPLLALTGLWGLVFLALGLILIWLTWHLDHHETATPYLMMMFCCLCGLVAALGRIDRGLFTALLSRYHVFQMFYFLAFMWLLILYLMEKGSLRRFAGVICAILAVILISNWVSGIGLGFAKLSWTRPIAKALKEGGENTPYSVLRPIYPCPPEGLKGDIRSLKELKYSVFR